MPKLIMNATYHIYRHLPLNYNSQGHELIMQPFNDGYRRLEWYLRV